MYLTSFITVKFLEGWDKMATNGYDSLTDGPEEGWLGYYSLDQQGKMEGASLKTMIEENAETGLVWTDPTVRSLRPIVASDITI